MNGTLTLQNHILIAREIKGFEANITLPSNIVENGERHIKIIKSPEVANIRARTIEEILFGSSLRCQLTSHYLATLHIYMPHTTSDSVHGRTNVMKKCEQL